MNSPTKTFRRLGIVGAAAVVGLVPLSIVGGAVADAAVSNATLTVSPVTTGSTSQVVDSFTTGTALPSLGYITLVSTDTSGCPIGLPSAPTTLGGTGTQSYTVSFTPSGGSSTAEPTTGSVVAATGTITCTGTTYAAGTAANTVKITVPTAIPAGSAVTVTINGAQNPTNASGVFFQDSTSTDTQVINTNVVTIGTAVVSTPGVTSVNPTAYGSGTGEPFTITGTNFSTNTSPASPIVCFVASGTTVPVPGTGTSSPCTGTGTAPATGLTTAPGEIQGTSPTTLVAGSYNVVVYNWNPSANSGAGGYTAASGTSSQTLVGVATTLNVVPEAGVRVVDTRAGLNLPRGPLATGTPSTPTSIPLADFTQSLTLPTNLPGTYTGLAVNVTAVAPASGGNIQMWGASGTCANGLTPGAIKPATVNFQPPQDTNNSQIIPVTGDTELCVQDNGAAVNLVVDIVGYTTAAYTQANTRILDTRPASQTGSLQGPLQSNTVYQVQTGLAGETVALNIAAVAPSSPGNLRVFPQPASGPPAPSAVPNAVVDNYIVNTDSSAMLITTIPASGFLDVYSAMGGAGTVNVVIDDLGDLSAVTSLHPVAQPYRIYDSRPGPIPAAGTVTVVGAPTGSGTNFTPATALGLVGNLSDINPAGQGYIVTFPAGGTVPGTASEADFPLQTRNTNNMVALNPSNGSFSIYAGGSATNSTYDVSAWIG